MVLVTRPTAYEALLAEHATHGQAAWYLQQQEEEMDPYLAHHNQQQHAVRQVVQGLPEGWKLACVSREDLDRFLFTPDDVVVAVGQDGLVPNVARYAEGQPVLGVHPDPDRAGLMVRYPAEAVADLLRSRSRWSLETRTMVQAVCDDGQRLLALNEIFVGHRSHQSARYRLEVGDRAEQQSSSGLIVASGTGATGWAKSLHRCHGSSLALPEPVDPDLVFFVREAWPSPFTGADLVEGCLASGQSLRVVSRMEHGGCVFGDGMEQDALRLPWARSVRVERAQEVLRLVV